MKTKHRPLLLRSNAVFLVLEELRYQSPAPRRELVIWMRLGAILLLFLDLGAFRGHFLPHELKCPLVHFDLRKVRDEKRASSAPSVWMQISFCTETASVSEPSSSVRTSNRDAPWYDSLILPGFGRISL